MFEAVQEFMDAVMRRDRDAVLLAISLYLWCVGMYCYVYLRRMARWPSTPGTTRRLGLRYFAGVRDWVQADQDYVLDGVYEYEVDGVRYQGSRVSPWPVKASHNFRGVLLCQLRGVEHTADGRIRVYYDPRRPKRSILILPGRKSFIAVLLIAWGPILLYILTH